MTSAKERSGGAEFRSGVPSSKESRNRICAQHVESAEFDFEFDFDSSLLLDTISGIPFLRFG